MIIDCAVYEKGVRRPGVLPFDEAFEACRGEGSFVWLGMADPVGPEFDSIAKEFHLHDLAVEDAVEAHQRPKVEDFGGTLLVVLKTAHYVDSDEVIQIGELVLFVHPDFVITVRHGRGPLDAVRRKLEADPERLAMGPPAVLHAVLDRVVDDYEDAVQGIDNDIQEVEKQVFSPSRREANPSARIYNLEREVLDFYRAVAPLMEAVGTMARGQFPQIPTSLREYYRDVEDHLRRVDGRIRSFRELLSSALQANLTQVSVRQNDDMRRISAWVAILAVPTMIAGIYGMNFQHMPELAWEFGYPAVWLLILVSCLLLYWRFRRSGWL